MASQFARDLQLVDMRRQSLAPALAAFARSELALTIASGAASVVRSKLVNGRRGVEEESVLVPGPIEYEFAIWPEIVDFTLQALVDRSPERSGRYKQSWFVMVAGGRIKDPAQIPPRAAVTFCNDQPYSRKIDVGHMKMSVPPGIVEDARRTVLARYGNLVTAQRMMVPLPRGYVLKGDFVRGIGTFARKRLSKGTQAGAQMHYPALVLAIR